jgi:hypothetical protein
VTIRNMRLMGPCLILVFTNGLPKSAPLVRIERQAGCCPSPFLSLENSWPQEVSGIPAIWFEVVFMLFSWDHFAVDGALLGCFRGDICQQALYLCVCVCVCLSLDRKKAGHDLVF